MKELLLTYTLLCGADAGLTHYGLAQGYTREAWLPTQNPWVIDGLVAGQATLAGWALSKQAKTHPKVARVIAWTIIGIRAGAVAWNVHQLVK